MNIERKPVKKAADLNKCVDCGKYIEVGEEFYFVNGEDKVCGKCYEARMMGEF